ncbi:universal stress protein [Geobacter argillaceus]|uniref:Nucleotide-binding universal stress UspA family protein n=1 Tax=Geobacter argillaceus TaxID=345631 RepID=A0A562VIL4_9BACT|nr:universal stress protein [Geobacter argillaceus]TWJ17786.1 nucleotide-binding universal stress UspA family protein [Geobacter argillaceus]
MKFKDILVHIDNSQQCANRLELAIKLAREHEAHLTGLYIITHSPYESQSIRVKQDEAQAEAKFVQKTGEADISAEWVSADWARVGVGMEVVLNHYAHSKDLIIVGQTDPGVLPGDVPPDLPQRIVVGAGRPVLVVPYTGTFATVGKRAIVAWKAGRAAARAVNDALPFLLNAEEVSVLTIRDPDEQGSEERTDGGIRVNLERHAIRVKEAHIVMKNIPVANLLMNYAWENSCDLIVMGVYAQISRGKYDLGPVAKDFFDHMTLPVLMSH